MTNYELDHVIAKHRGVKCFRPTIDADDATTLMVEAKIGVMPDSLTPPRWQARYDFTSHDGMSSKWCETHTRAVAEAYWNKHREQAEPL